MKVIDHMAPFYRRGQARELTASDYAIIAGVTPEAAKKRLQRMVEDHRLTVQRIWVGSHVAIYRVAE